MMMGDSPSSSMMGDSPSSPLKQSLMSPKPKVVAISRRSLTTRGQHNVSQQPIEPMGCCSPLYQKSNVNLPKGEGKLYSRFYRDAAVMDIVGSVVLYNVGRANLLNGTSQKVRVWCCGCSSGEEVYSMRFLWSALLEDHFGSHMGIEILGTDISETQIATCCSAKYTSNGMGTLPKGWKDRFFSGAVGEELVGSTAAARFASADDAGAQVEQQAFAAAGEAGSVDKEKAGAEGGGKERDAGRERTLVEPEVGMAVICSSCAPQKLRAVFDKESGDSRSKVAILYYRRLTAHILKYLSVLNC